MSDRPTAIDLFCGAGGLSRGLEQAGFNVLWAVDSDTDAIETYRQNHPDTKYGAEIGDLSELEPETAVKNIEPDDLDLIAGGPPCPTFSKIGRSKIKSLDGQSPESDDRHHLYEDFLRFVEHLTPRTFLMENVTGMLSSTGANGEPIVNIIRKQMEALDYSVTVQKVDAANFGVPQHRTRLFFIGQRDKSDRIDLEEWETHREPRNETERQMKQRDGTEKSAESSQTTMTEFGVDVTGFNHEFQKHPGDKLPFVTVADAILDLPPLSPGGGMPPKEATEYTVPALSEYQEWARDLSEETEWEDATLSNHSSRGHNHKDLTLYKILGEGVGWNIGDIASHLDPYRADIFPDSYKKQNPKKPASTIVAHLQKDGHMFIHPREARSLSVREAARLQSFRDSFKLPTSRTSGFRLVGNAVPPLLAQAAGKAIRSELL
ncbi:DNA cytosine methyltransferase [Haloarcula sediminis]|uniref:DNA cytosine methyltransferase n=1 Tax=Haloarcula sediminis TaxID=3111777 RepID=UPI002D784068|nr:DNA cytosine methyltransferase [Haloarcula sp. CK38]